MATKLYISPSDLTFGFSNCHRCLWLKYNENLVQPGMMPLVSTLAALQEGRFAHGSTRAMSLAMPPGRVVDAGGWVESDLIAVGGQPTPFRIRGKYDLLVEFEDGTHGVVDCKVSGSIADKAGFYGPQLEAYAFALEQPKAAAPKTVSSMGLLVWAPNRVSGDETSGYAFGVDAAWQPIARNPQALQDLLAKFISVISSEQPPASGERCDFCKYQSRRSVLGW